MFQPRGVGLAGCVPCTVYRVPSFFPFPGIRRHVKLHAAPFAAWTHPRTLAPSRPPLRSLSICPARLLTSPLGLIFPSPTRRTHRTVLEFTSRPQHPHTKLNANANA